MSSSVLERVRRNHALEHASINVLSERHKGFGAQGNSTPGGFHLNIYGKIRDEEIYEAVEDAYRRLKAGESRLGLHPTCGTVLLTSAALAAATAQVSFMLEMRRQRRSNPGAAGFLTALPVATLAVMLSLFVAKPLGMAIQESYTVDSDLGDLRIASIRPLPPSLITRLFRLLLGQSKKPMRSYRIDTVA